MRNALNRIRESLTRKLGPLPVWAWALIAGAGLYVYRMRQSGGAVDTASTTDTTGAEVADQSPTVLQPGESALTPGGGLVTAPGGGTGAESPSPLSPISLAPGQTVYDPNTGTGFTAPGGPNSDGTGAQTNPGKNGKPKGTGAPKSKLAQARARVALGRGGTKTSRILLKAGYSRGQIAHAKKHHTQLGPPSHKRQKKPKTQHGKTNKVPHHSAKRSTARSAAIGRTHTHAQRGPGAPKARARGRASGATPKPRVRATPAPKPVTRAHPAPTKKRKK